MQLQMGTKLEQQVGALIEPTIVRLGCRLVRVKLLEGQKRRILQIMIERADLQGTTVDHCAEVSTMISPLLDVEDLISGEYDLEVSTPGIDRPLTIEEDFNRFKGFDVKIMTSYPINDRRKFTGKLLGIDAEEVVSIDVSLSLGKKIGEEVVSIKGEDIASAKLILTDELLSAHSDILNANDNNNEVV